ncbi:hypothetical protein IMY05_C4650000200 [Salix suchowensis]|nr:hypothetical protein IMY05_C4650000200 [Salix suchowensis]
MEATGQEDDLKTSPPHKAWFPRRLAIYITPSWIALKSSLFSRGPRLVEASEMIEADRHRCTRGVGWTRRDSNAPIRRHIQLRTQDIGPTRDSTQGQGGATNEVEENEVGANFQDGHDEIHEERRKFNSVRQVGGETGAGRYAKIATGAVSSRILRAHVWQRLIRTDRRPQGASWTSMLSFTKSRMASTDLSRSRGRSILTFEERTYYGCPLRNDGRRSAERLDLEAWKLRESKLASLSHEARISQPWVDILRDKGGKITVTNVPVAIMVQFLMDCMRTHERGLQGDSGGSWECQTPTAGRVTRKKTEFGRDIRCPHLTSAHAFSFAFCHPASRNQRASRRPSHIFAKCDLHGTRERPTSDEVSSTNRIGFLISTP